LEITQSCQENDVASNKENIYPLEVHGDHLQKRKSPILNGILDLEKLSNNFSSCLSTSLKKKWHMLAGNDHLSFKYFEEQVQMIDGVQVQRNMKVYNDLSWSVKVHHYNVPSKVIIDASLVPLHLVLPSDLGDLLDASSKKSQMCAGCPKPEFMSLPKQCISQQGTIIGKSQIITEGLKTVEIKRSTSCQGLVMKDSKSKCPSCFMLNKVL
jgi:hypothetical protein